jgi:hypothetical protein
VGSIGYVEAYRLGGAACVNDLRRQRPGTRFPAVGVNKHVKTTICK